MTPDEQRTVDAWVKAHVEILSAAFDQAQRYSNLFILAGYGSFFGLWNITRDRLFGRHAALWAALSMLVSVTIFISYQIFSVFQSSSALVRLSEALIDSPPTGGDDLVRRYEEHGYLAKQRAPKLLKLWRPIFFVTVGFGFVGLGILAWAFVQALWSCPVPYSCL